MMDKRSANSIIDILHSEGIYEADKQLRILNGINGIPVFSAINEIENLMERWHLARDNDDETLQSINDVLVNIGLLSFFNDKK